jgi:FAD:protein FMN transferase
MQDSRLMMGMPVTVEVVDPGASPATTAAVFKYFQAVDDRFSTYKKTSEISRLNDGLVPEDQRSPEMREVLALCAETAKLTDGYFDIVGRDGRLEPAGLVKGWAIRNAANLLLDLGFRNFYIDAGGDIQTRGMNANGEKWKVGIRDPFGTTGMVKVLRVSGEGVATSGTYLRGQHIYDPHRKDAEITDIVSLTVVGPDVYEADRFATAAFAMGRAGIAFIARMPGLEGYMVDSAGMATMTPGFARYVLDAPTHA